MEINLILNDKALTFKNCSFSDDGNRLIGENDTYRVEIIATQGPSVSITKKQSQQVETKKIKSNKVTAVAE